MNSEPNPKDPRSLDETALARLLQTDAENMELPPNRPSAGHLWWKAQILRRLSETNSDDTVNRRKVPILFPMAALLFILWVNLALISLLPETQNLSPLIYALLSLLPIAFGAFLAWASRNS